MPKTHSVRTASLVITLIAIVGLTLPVRGDEERPFKGHANEERISVQPIDGGKILVTTTGAGQATHLGSFTRLASVVINLVDGSSEGTVVFTAANGDRLFAEAAGRRISPTTAVGTYTFTGGTGRFIDAVGAADFEGFTSDGIHIAIVFEGTIQY